jgi:hypothetical protein
MQDIMSFNQKGTPKDIWKYYDPDKAREGLRKSAGALKGVAAEALKQDIADQRGQESHGSPAS